MKNFKYYILILTLFLQGCEPVPLFLEKDGIHPDEGIVVYSIYYPAYTHADLKDLDRSIIAYGNYAFTEWSNLEDQSIIVYESNYLKVEGLTLQYAVMKLKAGEYYLKKFQFYRGSVIVNGKIGTERIYNPIPYNFTNSPLRFTLKPGEVIYIGSFEYLYGVSRGYFKQKNYFNDAKAILSKHYPTFAPKLKNALIN